MCSICNYTHCHPRCPNYIPQKSRHFCDVCGEGICKGEEYIENSDGECRHYDCFQGIKELLNWLGYEIKIMEDDEY